MRDRARCRFIPRALGCVSPGSANPTQSTTLGNAFALRNGRRPVSPATLVAGSALGYDYLNNASVADEGAIGFEHLASLRLLCNEPMTRPGGYRFLADVTGERVPPTDFHRVEIADAGVPPKRPHRSHAWIGFGAGLVLVLAASLSWNLTSQSQSSPKIRSLAVLPLESLSGDASQ